MGERASFCFARGSDFVADVGESGAATQCSVPIGLPHRVRVMICIMRVLVVLTLHQRTRGITAAAAAVLVLVPHCYTAAVCIDLRKGKGLVKRLSCLRAHPSSFCGAA